jgi:hypothetical protein
VRAGDVLRGAVLAIAALTIVTGLSQVFWPGPMLTLVGAASGPGDRHLFATVGMFMALFGGGVWHSERSAVSRGEILPWATLQKAGAALLVSVGAWHDVFARRALLVAAFDGLSAILFAVYLLKRRR